MALKGETVQPRGMYQRSRSNGVGMIIAPPQTVFDTHLTKNPNSMVLYTRMTRRAHYLGK
jgi:hypothetical protein